MKSYRPEQQTLLDLISVDSNRIPRFIDGKTDYDTFLKIQTIYVWIYELAQPTNLNEFEICQIDKDITDILKTIREKPLNKKCTAYVYRKLQSYWDIAVELEAYEAAGNFKKLLKPIVE